MLKLKLILFLLLVLLNKVNAQSWVPVVDTILSGGTATSFVQNSDGSYLIGTSRGIYKSYNEGHNWEPKNSGINPPSTSISGLVELNSNIYFNNSGSLFQSTDNGETWGELVTDLPYSMGSLFSWNNSLYTYINQVSTYYRSTNGINWTITSFYGVPINDTLSNVGLNANNDSILVFDEQNNTYGITLPPSLLSWQNYRIVFNKDNSYCFVIIVNDGKVYRADRNANPITWQLISQLNYPVMYSSDIQNIYNSGDNLFVTIRGYYQSNFQGLFYKTYRSGDNGITWQTLPPTCGLPSGSLNRFYSVQGDTIIACAHDSKLYYSNNGGLNWEDRTLGIFTNYMGKITQTSNALVAKPLISGLIETGIIRSIDGKTWKKSMSGIPKVPHDGDSLYMVAPRGYVFSQTDSLYFVAYDINKFYKSFDEGLTWHESSFPVSSGSVITCQYGDENTTFLTHEVSIDSMSGDQTLKFIRSNDYCSTWDSVPAFDSLYQLYGFPHIINGQHDTMLTCFGNRPFYSSTNGDSWNMIPLPVNYTINSINVLSEGYFLIADFSSSSNAILASANYNAGGDSLFWWQNGVWTKITPLGLPSGIDMKTIHFINNMWHLTSNLGVFVSNDNGHTWNVGSSRISESGNQNTIFSFNDQLMGKSPVDLKVLNNSHTLLSAERDALWYFDPNAMPVGINTIEPIHNKELLAYPNPASEYIFISLFEEQMQQYKLYDALGTIVKQSGIDKNSSNIYVGDLKEGIYFLKLSSNKSQKIIVLKK